MASETKQVYVCKECGSMVEVLQGGSGTLVCCSQPMELQKENTVDAAKEKHVPVVEKTADGMKVTVGSVAHPMTEEHYIQWIEVVCEHGVIRKVLKPGDAPEATFPVKPEEHSGEIIVRAYCNLHGLWKSA